MFNCWLLIRPSICRYLPCCRTVMWRRAQVQRMKMRMVANRSLWERSLRLTRRYVSIKAVKVNLSSNLAIFNCYQQIHYLFYFFNRIALEVWINKEITKLTRGSEHLVVIVTLQLCTLLLGYYMAYTKLNLEHVLQISQTIWISFSLNLSYLKLHQCFNVTLYTQTCLF